MLFKQKNRARALGPVRTHNYVGKKGVLGRNGTGRSAYVPVPLEWRATTTQICGLYPFSAPGKLPMAGGPIGRHIESGATVCFDHIGWFLARLIANPSLTIIAMPGLGKSTLAKKIALNLAAQGYVVDIPGDTKGEYLELTRALGGKPRKASRYGGSALNPCDPGGMAAAAKEIGGEAGAALLAEAIGRAVVCVSTLVELGRKDGVADYEETAVGVALLILYAQDGPEPLLADVLELLGERPASIRKALFDGGSDEKYDELINPLRRSLATLLGGKYGDVFSRRVDRPTGRPMASCLDTSSIKSGDAQFLAAVLIAGWSDTYGRVEADQARAAAGLIPKPRYCLVLDELWRVLQLGGTMTSRVDELTRLNRTEGIGQIMITHSTADASGTLLERTGATMIGGVPRKELERLEGHYRFTERERSSITGWWSESVTALAAGEVPPGAGKFLLKAGSDNPGIPVDVRLTSVEAGWGGQDTNQAWEMG